MFSTVSIAALACRHAGAYVNELQRRFLERLAKRIPRLFDVIAAGNTRAEYTIGIRQVGQRRVRLVLVADVVGSVDTAHAPAVFPASVPGSSGVVLRSVADSLGDRKHLDRSLRNGGPPAPEPDH